MFGPNAQYRAVYPREYCHRSNYATQLAAEIKQRLSDLFDLRGYDILLIPGPATVAMQTVLDSMSDAPWVIGEYGKFIKRWHSIADSTWGGEPIAVYCRLETSLSLLCEGSYHGITKEVVDAVSSFPYYPIQKESTIAFVTTSCKQLGGPPGFGIVGVRKDSWVHFDNYGTRADYTNIHNHRHGFYTTAPVNVLEVLETTLNEDYFKQQRAKIDGACELLDKAIPEDLTIGSRHCPVITIRRKEFDARYPDAGSKFQLYPENNPDSETYHVFTYSEDIEDYQRLADYLKH